MVNHMQLYCFVIIIIIIELTKVFFALNITLAIIIIIHVFCNLHSCII